VVIVGALVIVLTINRPRARIETLVEAGPYVDGESCRRSGSVHGLLPRDARSATASEKPYRMVSSALGRSTRLGRKLSSTSFVVDDRGRWPSATTVFEEASGALSSRHFAHPMAPAPKEVFVARLSLTSKSPCKDDERFRSDE
jgi:hypothetical protein